MRVKDIMTPDPATCRVEADVARSAPPKEIAEMLRGISENGQVMA